MFSIIKSPELRKLIYEEYCPVVAQLLSISTPFRFIELNPTADSVAYTVLDGSRVTNVYINPYHSMFGTIPDPARQAAVFTGVLVHEMLHKKYTEPAYAAAIAEKEQVLHRNLFHAIDNIIEDFTIESRAVLDLRITDETLRLIERSAGITLSGKKPLTALDSAIITSWTQSPPVHPDEPVCLQVLNALIDFTDLGPLVPGSVLCSEAAQLYREVTPLIYDAIWKPPLERAQTALKVYQAMEPFLGGNDQTLSSIASDTQGTNGEASSEAVDQENRAAVENSDAMKAKVKIVEQLRQQADQSDDSASEAGCPGKNAKEAEDAARQTSETSSVNSAKNSADKADGADGNPASSDSESSSPQEESVGENEQTDISATQDKQKDSGDDGSTEAAQSTPQPSDKESPELPPDAFVPDPDILKRIRSVQADTSNEQFDISDLKPGSLSVGADFSRQDSQTIDYSLDQNVESDFFSGTTVNCRNYRVSGVSKATYELYESIRRRNASEIARFTRHMKQLASETETKSCEKNGRLNMRRYAEKGFSTVNLFTRKAQKDRRNARVLVCLDVSGSMSGNKISKAGEALVCLVEGLSGAGIPVKVITFCEQGDGVVHHHYVNYGNSRIDRASLMLIEAGGRNFDGFSIRYAVKDLMKKRVSHDILIIISDGQPNTGYVDRKNVLADTAAAVTEAKRLTRVIGIGIDANIDILKGFYKDTFVEMTDIENLMKNLTRLIEKEVRSW